VGDLWTKYVQLYEAHKDDSSDERELGEPATDEAIAEVEELLGQPITADLRALLKVNDGSANVGLFSAFNQTFSCDDLKNEVGIMRDLWEDDWKDDNETNGANPHWHTDAGIKVSWWRPNWLPISGDGNGNLIVMDFEPDVAKGGVVGQVFNHDHVMGDHKLLAKSLAALLQGQIEQIEAGVVVWDEGMDNYNTKAFLDEC